MTSKIQYTVHIFSFFLKNFGPLAIFYAVNYFWSFQAAIFISITWVAFEFIYMKARKEKLTSFFYFSSSIIAVFGIIDLSFQEPILIKYEAALMNLFCALFFGISLFNEKTIIQELAENQKRIPEEGFSATKEVDMKFFFKFFTLLWWGYFSIKAVFYLILATQNPLNEIFLIKMVIGKISFWIMMFISVVIPHRLWVAMEYFKWFPSQRDINKD